MADANESGNGASQEQQMPQMYIAGQFVRDLSFENIAAQSHVDANVQPEISVDVALDARKRKEEHYYDIIIKLNISSKAKGTTTQIFVLELDYCGVFRVEGVAEDQLHPFLLIECPRNLFPFVRRIVHDVTRDGGFPPLNLDNIDFLQLYRQQVAANQKKQEEEAKTPAN